MRLIRVPISDIEQLPRPRQFFVEAERAGSRDGDAIRFDLDDPAYIAFESRWVDYEPSDEDLSRSPRSLVREAATGIVGLTVAGISLTGLGLATREQRLFRAARCSRCPNLRPGGVFWVDTCSLCGCVLTAKRRLASEVCPDVPPRW